MAYQAKEQKIVPGGLNLLAPGDQVSENDCLDLTDFWPGAAGRLEQAPQLALLNSPLVFSAQDSLCQADGRVYYGGGGNLFQVGRDGAGTPIDTGYDGYPLGLISYQGYCWVMNRAAGKQRKDDGSTVTAWTPAPPGVPSLYDIGVAGAGAAGVPAPNNAAVNNPPEVGGLLAQEYTYYCTWQLTLGESNPSAVAGVLTPTTVTPALDGSIVRIVQPASPPSNATGWNIYRKSPTFSAPYRLNENPIDITRTYVDDYGDEVHTHSDTELLALGIIMEVDHDAAPAARVTANNIYNDRIVVANSAANPNRIWFTQAQQPGFFRGAADANTGDWIDVGTDKGDEVLAMTTRPNALIIYRARSIWRLVGDFGDTNSRLEVIVPDVGIVGPRAVVSTSLGDYCIGSEAVYRFNNDWAQKNSSKVEPILRGLATENFTTLGTAYRSKCAIGYRNGRLWISYPASSGTMTKSLIYHTESDRWFAGSSAYAAFLDTGTAFLGAGAGIFTLESTYSTSATLLAYQSAYQDCNLPDHEKTWADLVINHNTQGQALTIIARTNKKAGSNDSFTLQTITSSALTKTIVPLVYPAGYAVVALRGLPIRAYNLSIRITGGGGSGTPTVIESPLILHYYVEARRAKRFDTSVTDHRIEDVKTVDQVEIDVDATDGDATLQVSSDLPGGVVIAREGGGQTVTQTSGRQSRRVVLTNPADGRLLRYELTTTTDFQVYGMRARVLPIGVYLDGTVGDFWAPQPISIGV